MKYLRLAAVAGLGLAQPALAQLPVTFTINTTTGRQPISPLIYGTNQPLQLADNYGSVRLGGNRLTGYNWENNASNAGTDYLNQSDSFLCTDRGIPAADCDNVPGKVVTSFVQGVRARPGIPVALPTLQMAGYVAADKSGPVGAAQAAPSVRWKPVVARKPGALVYPPDPTDDAVYMDEQVQYLVSTFGLASAGGVRGYFLDNEPALWPGTHPRIHAAATGAAELWTRSRDLAQAVKSVDPSAEVFGGVFYGFSEYYNEQSAPDWNAEKGSYAWYVDYYLARMKAASTTAGRRLLDVLDLHWYPEATGDDNGTQVRVTGSSVAPAVRQARMQAPRSLWQPGYRENSYIAAYFSQFLPLIPVLKNSIAAQYPDTRLSFSEYNYGGCDDISGGIAQADVLGIFGQQGVYNANWWDACGSGAARSYISPAFRLYTNYDGNNAHFGSTSVSAATSDVANTSVYAAIQGSSEGRLTLVVLNKSSQPVQGTYNLSSGARYATARAWGFDQGSPALVARASPVIAAGATSFTYTVPALSATTLELTTAPLPVVLVSFTGQARPTGGVGLHWRTASEQRAAAFEVQRSTDSQLFGSVLRVPATNTAVAHDYAAHDAPPVTDVPAGLLYYRLRLLDQDSSATFSPVLAVARPAVGGFSLAALPNPAPAGQALRLTVQSDGSAQVATLAGTNLLGQVVLRRPVSVPTGTTTLAVPEAAAWRPGLYLLTLHQADGRLTRQKVVVE